MLSLLSADKLAKLLEENAPPPITKPQIIQLRHKFTPEVVIPTQFSPISIKRTAAKTPSIPLLLDFDQEWCVKNNLYLPEEAEAVIQTETVQTDTVTSQLVTGVAGSGKSLILLYRALLNAQLNPDAKVLILTHNRPINNELQSRFNHLNDKKLNITWLTFFQWARQELNREDWHERTLYPREVEKIIDDIIRDFPDNQFTTSFLVNEFGFIKDHQITSLPAYQSLDRKGQHRGLNANQRANVWAIFKQYQIYLRDHKLVDWHNVAMRFHKKAIAGKCNFPRYHCILIDEAQFFAKSWFDIVKKALIPGGQLFLSADPTQGFLKRRQSWISSGIEVRGRTTKLHKAYRNSREILQFATDFYHRRQSETDSADEDINLLSDEQINQAPTIGSHPIIIPTSNHQDSNNQLVLHLKQLANELQQANLPTSDQVSILIIHADSNQLKPLISTLSIQLPHLNFHDIRNKSAPPETFAKLTTLNAATGLEASIVFLLGVDSLLDKENSPLLDEEERHDLIKENTRLLYMGFTRTAQKLIIFSKNLVAS